MNVNWPLLKQAGFVILAHTLCSSIHESLYISGFKLPWVLTLIEFFINFSLECIFAYRRRASATFSGKGGGVLNSFRLTYVMIAFLLVIERLVSNVSFLYLNYPTQQLLKSIKIVFIVAVGMQMGIGPSKKEALYAAGLALGLVTFSIAEARETHKFSWTGIALVVIGLVLSALYSNMQQLVLNSATAPSSPSSSSSSSSSSSVSPSALSSPQQSSMVLDDSKGKRRYKRIKSGLVFWQYATGTLLLLIVTGINGELQHGVKLCKAQPIVVFKMLLYGVPLYLGIQVLLDITAQYGVTLTTTVTSTRKVLFFAVSYTMLPSHTKPFTLWHALGIIISLVFTFLIQSQTKRSNQTPKSTAPV